MLVFILTIIIHIVLFSLYFIINAIKRDIYQIHKPHISKIYYLKTKLNKSKTLIREKIIEDIYITIMIFISIKTHSLKIRVEDIKMYTLAITTLIIPIASIYLTIKFTLLENNIYENLLKSTGEEFNQTSMTLLKSLTRHVIDVTSALLPAIKIISEHRNMEKYILKITNWLSEKISKLIKSITNSVIHFIFKIILLSIIFLLLYKLNIHKFIFQDIFNNLDNILKIIQIVCESNPFILIGSSIVIISPLIILLFIKSLISATYKCLFFIISCLYLFKNIGFLGF